MMLDEIHLAIVALAVLVGISLLRAAACSCMDPTRNLRYSCH